MAPAENIPPPHFRRNLTLGVLNGMLFTLAETLTDPALVITWFLANLSASNFLIGLVVPLRDAGWFLPQLFVSHGLGRLRYKMTLYRDTAVVRVGAWVGITLTVFAVRSPGVMIACFVALYTLYSLASGVAGLPFMDITAKTIPPRQRGRYFGERLFWGGLLGIGGGYLVKLVLEDRLGVGLGFPNNVGVLMLLTTIISAVALALFIQTIEPPDQVLAQASSLRDHLRSAVQLPGRDANFGLYLAARSVLMLGGIATPFLAVYAARTLQAGPGMIGIYLTVRTGASLISNRLWSWLADHYSGRWVLQSSAVQSLAAMLAALALAPLAQALALPPETGPWLFTLVFVLIGSASAAVGVAGSSLMLNLAPDAHRSIYVGFANTVLGLATLFTGLGGLVADAVGFQGVFLLAALCCGLSIVATARMQEGGAGVSL